MKIYRVGGYVRDKLLGIVPNDCDYVVIGSNEQEMLKLGYKKVGNHFPVFLHPKTHEEYALARTEKKSGLNHTSFIVDSCNISLEDDLFRRDITINAIAEDENGDLIDPYNGISDIKNRIIRHVSLAFIEDPLRILRIARFRAKLDFDIATETYQLLKQMTSSPDAMTISKERIIEELHRALKVKYTSLFFITLKEINGLNIFFPQLSTNILNNFNEFTRNIDKLESNIEKLLYLSEYSSNNYSEIALDKNTLKKIKLYKIIININPNDTNTELLNKLKQLNVWREYKMFKEVIKYNININQILHRELSNVINLINIVDNVVLSNISHIVKDQSPSEIKNMLQDHYEAIIANTRQ